MQNVSFGPLSQRDQELIWHPFTQHQIEPHSIAIKEGKDCLLIDENGKTYIDAISSWWVSIHGHGNAYLAKKVFEQALKLEQVIFAGFTHEPAIQLSERLLKHLPSNFEKLFFSDNGSTSVEVAIKMALQYFHNHGNGKKQKIIAFQDAYHGDTFGTMSLGTPSSFNAPFQDMLFEVEFLPSPLNEVECLAEFKDKLKKHEDYAAFIFEPIVQGAGGMKIYRPAFLDQLIQLAKEHQVFCIADEIMTGFGRLGTFFASDQLNQKPDIICLSKGLTGGMMAMGITACSNEIFEAFLSLDRKKTFYHSHSFTGNPMTCAAANASLDLLESESYWTNIKHINTLYHKWAVKMANHPKVENCRIIGTILAFEFKNEDPSGYLNTKRDFIYQFCLDHGVLIRPLGNTIYLLPPYIITEKEISTIFSVLEKLLEK